MTPDDAVLRWGNFNGTFLLSSRVFEPDDTGRSYRLRPHVASVWLGLARCRAESPVISSSPTARNSRP